MIPGEKIEIENLDNLIKNHMAFIIRTVSNITGRYVSVENDEEFSIGLSAFAESVSKFDEKRGPFLGFAKIVIESRVKSYMAREQLKESQISLDALYEDGLDFSDKREENNCYREEILIYKDELSKFGLTFEDLVDASPKHEDTRARGIYIGKKASEDKAIVEETYRKRKLPIRAVARVADVTEKIVKGSKLFILGSMLIFVNKLTNIISFISGTGCKNV